MELELQMNTSVPSLLTPTFEHSRNLSLDEIARYLPVYKPEHIYIVGATYRDGTLETLFKPYDPGLYRSPMKHTTRVQLVHYIGQAAYVLGGCLAEAGRLSPLDEGSYIDRVKDERATFRKLRLSFRNFIEARDHLKVAINTLAIRRIPGAILMALDIKINGGECFGKAEAVGLL